MMKNVLVIFFLFLAALVKAQPLLIPQNRFATIEIEKRLKNYHVVNFTTSRPIIANQIGYDTLQQQIIESQKRVIRNNLFARKLKQEHLLQIKKENFYLAIDPVFDMYAYKDFNADTATYYTNTRGLFVEGALGKRVAFYSSFYESQSFFPKYLSDFANLTDVAPGMGRHKTFRVNGYDYAMASGVLSIDLTKFINVQAGQGKNFIGDGYRSLLLSDNAFNYPFVKTQIHYKRFQYIFAYASLQEIGGLRNLHPGLAEPLFTRKPFTFQFLQFQIKKRIQLGFFQSTMFYTRDSARAYTFDYNILNPVIGLNGVKYGLNNNNNVLLGLTARLRLTHDLIVYGQLAMDDTDPYKKVNSIRNKYAYQWGFRLNNAFILKNLVVQFEQNRVRPYTYSASRTWQNYSHYNQSMAHPLGANFKENVIFVNYRIKKDFILQFKYSRVFQGIDSINGGNTGSNIFLSDLTASNGYYSGVYKRINGYQTDLRYISFRFGYVVNYTTNLTIFVEAQQRNFDGLITPRTSSMFGFIGITSNLFNLYHDF
jgi:hypothetical protein